LRALPGKWRSVCVKRRLLQTKATQPPMLEGMQDETRDEAHWEASEEGAELLREGEVEAAVTELQNLILRDPENPYGHFFLGSAYFESGDPLRALKAYLRAVELKPDYIGALTHAGWSLHALGRFKDALRVGHQVLHRAKEDQDALYLMGLCHYALGEPAAALSYLNRFLATRPDAELMVEVEGLIKVLRGEVQPLSDPDDDDDD
jgi:tetratricopeptide (TPR) repeat protein